MSSDIFVIYQIDNSEKNREYPLNYEGVAFIQAVPKAGYPGLASYMYHTCRSITAASSRSTTTPPTTCGIIKLTNPPISI